MKVMTFEEAVEYFRDLFVMTSAEYETLVAEVGEYASALAFTVSRIAAADLLQDLHGEILKAIDEGRTFWDFRESIDEIMKRRGWEGLEPYRLDNIFRTNIQTAYNAGRYKQMKAIADRRPYWEYDAVNDAHTRPSHLAQDGKIYRYDHPFWRTWYPSNGFRCFPPRTKVLTRSGWKEMGTILPEDRIIGGSGDEKRITAVHRNRFNGQLVRLIFENGRIDTTPNHRILTMRGWVRSDELNTADILVETNPVTPVNSLVGDKNMADTERGNSGMTLPIERETPDCFTSNTQVQFGYECVYPFGSDGRKDNVIVDDIETESSDVVDCHGLRPGRRCLAGRMIEGISPDYELVSLCKFLSHVSSPGGCGNPELFGNCPCTGINLFCVAEMPVQSLSFALQVEIPQLLGSIFAPLCGSVNPLGLDSITTPSGGDSKMPDDSDQCVVADSPSSTERPVRKLIFDVEQIKSIGDGAPLDRFDTLDSFITWARSHSILRKIVDIQTIPYNGIVVNLSVDTDESYIVQGATVHNCRCRVNSISAEEIEEEKLTEETEDTDLMPDDGFQFNPADESWKPDLKKYDPRLRAQLEEWIWD